jgi:predicted Zn finger-like uncharacterized protein
MKMKCPHCGVSGSVSDSLLGKKVKCPKCKEIFRVEVAKAPSAQKKEPIKEPIIEAPAPVMNAKPAPGMTAQDEASLEEEIAKIFDDMKRSTTVDYGADAEARARDDEYEKSLTDIGLTEKEDKREETETGTESINEDDLESQLEAMLGKKCSVCGAFVGQATKHEIGGNVYCSACLPSDGRPAEPGVSSEGSTSKDLTVSGPGLEDEPKMSGKKRQALLVALGVIFVILAALFYLIVLK